MAVIVSQPALTNPMTTSQDLVVAGSAGSPGRLGVGSNGQVLTVTAGVVGWAAASSGFANPMTTAGDIIKATTGGTAQRLAVGSNGQVLTVVSGAPAWAANAGGPPSGSAGGDLGGTYPNPSVLALDGVSVASAGTPAAGQVLTAVDGATADWQTTSLGLIPSGDTTGLTDDQAYYGALGTLYTSPKSGGEIVLQPGNYYTVAGWTVPQMKPLGYVTATTTSGSTAVTSIVAGSAAIPAAASVVDVYGVGIPVGTRMTMGTPNTTATLGNSACLGAGAGTKIWIGNTSTTDGNPTSLRGISWPILTPVGTVGTPTGIWCHRWNGNGSCPAGSNITGICIDGSSQTGQAFGVDWADTQSGSHLIVRVQNFVNSVSGNSHGAHLSNRYFFTEKTYIWVNATNCDNHVYITYNGSHGGDSSWEYNEMYFTCISQSQNQNGVVVDNVSLGGCEVHIKGNMPATTAASGAPANNAGTGTPAAALSFKTGTSNTQLFYGTLIMKLERDSRFGSSNVFPYTIYSDASAKVIMSNGRICTGLTGIKWNGPEFTFSGMIGGNDYTGTPGDLGFVSTLAASGSATKNVGPDAIARVTGGTITSITYQGMTLFSGGGGWFPLAAGASFICTGTGGQVYTLQPARVGGT